MSCWEGTLLVEGNQKKSQAVQASETNKLSARNKRPDKLARPKELGVFKTYVQGSESFTIRLLQAPEKKENISSIVIESLLTPTGGHKNIF